MVAIASLESTKTSRSVGAIRRGSQEPRALLRKLIARMMNEPNPVSSEFSSCPLARQNAELFTILVGDYGEIVQLAVREAVSGTDRHVFPKVRSVARRAGQEGALPQDLIAVHLSALAILVKNKPQAMVRACIRQSRLLLVKMVGELALYYRDQAVATKNVVAQ